MLTDAEVTFRSFSAEKRSAMTRASKATTFEARWNGRVQLLEMGDKLLDCRNAVQSIRLVHLNALTFNL